MLNLRNIMYFTMLFQLMTLNALANEPTGKVDRYEYEFPVTDGLATSILEKVNIFDLGAGVSHKFKFVQDNDNFLVGGGKFIGFEQGNFIEGDDKGQTFGFSLSYIANFEAGEVSLDYFSELYSRSAPQPKNYGRTESLKNPDTGFYYTENLVRDSIELEIKKDYNHNYYAVIGISLHHIEDTGIALSVQQGFHKLTTAMGNRPYSVIETGLNDNEINSSIRIGKRFIVTRKKDFEISLNTEVGYNLSNKEYWRAAFVKSSLELVQKNSKLKLYFEKDSKKYEKKGISWEYEFHSDSSYKISSYIGLYNQDNIYTKQYFDAGYENELIHEYGIKVRY
jgi:hypothetical protein